LGEGWVKRFLQRAAFVAGIACAGPAFAEDCLNPNALGTLRTLEVDSEALTRVGTMQYPGTLPLRPKEIVLTFDDGPMPPMTNRVLEVLRQECVRATFFLIGRNAKAFPSLVQRMSEDGHTVANHSQNHHLVPIAGPLGVQEFEQGFQSIAAALEPAGASPAPFFRFPGLLHSPVVESHAKAKRVTVMSADILADDWTPIGPDHILQRALMRLNGKGSGILLLHDVQPGLALALPKLLRELHARGYRVVHIVPKSTAEPTAAPPAATLVSEAKKPTTMRRPVARKPAPEAQPEVAEFPIMARWRKLMETSRHAAPSAAKIEFANY
jgi:peptidoglycan/xylan/chitin deacetylase (PgdA/CDA1 family)